MFTMFNKYALIAGLLFSNVAFAGNNDSAILSDKDSAFTVASSKNTWSVVAANTVKGLTKVREFHDMGQSGVQQIDYVVNCADQTLALADFAVITSKGRLPVVAKETSFTNLSFYKPMIEHDRAITNNACDKRMAMNGSSINE
jgi:hypothetical protein